MSLFKDHATEIKVKVTASVIAGLLLASILAIISFVPGVASTIWAWFSSPRTASVSQPSANLSPDDPSQQRPPLPKEIRSQSPGMLGAVISSSPMRGPDDFSKDRAEIRRHNNVAAMPPAHSGMTIGRLPRGIFGFIDADALATFIPQRGTLASDLTNIPLRASSYEADWEIHFTHGSDVLVLGVITNAILQELARPANDIRLLFLALAPGGTMNHMIGLPMARLILIESRGRGLQKVLSFEVRKIIPSPSSR